MDATISIDRSKTPGRARLLAQLALGLTAALGLGFALGHVTTSGPQSQQQVIKYVPVNVNGDHPNNAPSHRELW